MKIRTGTLRWGRVQSSRPIQWQLVLNQPNRQIKNTPSVWHTPEAQCSETNARRNAGSKVTKARSKGGHRLPSTVRAQVQRPPEAARGLPIRLGPGL